MSQQPTPAAATPQRVLSPQSSYAEDAARVTVMRALRIGLWVWPAFALLDVFMAYARFPEAPLSLFLLFRLFGELLLALGFAVVRVPGTSARRATAWYLGTFYMIGVLIVLMAFSYGGLVSSYMHGLSIVIIIQLVLFPGRYWRSIAQAAPVALTYPLLMGLAALLDESVRASATDAAQLAEFVSHYVFVLAAVLVGSWASHTMWTAREQVYRARRLGRYRLQAMIGRGGMGEVWLAWDENLRRNVALKIMRMQGEQQLNAVQRFEREARAASNLSSPHAIRIFDFGASDDGIHYIAMEHLQGLDLRTLVERHGPLPPMRALGLILQACDALAEAHDEGVVHRDIKPHNLFLTCANDNDFIKVLDFGIAKVREADRTLHGTSMIAGTPGYAAPEVWLGTRSDARQDVYGLGATLYFLLAGRAPSAPDEAAETSPVSLPSRRPPRPSERIGRSLPPMLEDVVLRCLDHDPAARYGDARELREALAPCMDPAGWTAAEARAFWAGVALRTDVA